MAKPQYRLRDPPLSLSRAYFAGGGSLFAVVPVTLPTLPIEIRAAFTTNRNMHLDPAGIIDRLRLGCFLEASRTACANARDRALDYRQKGPCRPLRVTHGIATPTDENSRYNSRIRSHTPIAERRHHAHTRHRLAVALLLGPSPDSRRQPKPITRSQADCYPPPSVQFTKGPWLT